MGDFLDFFAQEFRTLISPETLAGCNHNQDDTMVGTKINFVLINCY